jgi:hypothetical protein
MMLCKNCRKALPFLVAYVALLAAFLAFATGLLFDWHLVAMTGVFVSSLALGACYVTSCSCRLCRLYRHSPERRHA